MKIWRFSVWLCVLAMVGVCPAGEVSGATLTGRSSTVLEWFDDAGEDTAVPVYQYLRVNVTDIADGLHFRGYGRLADDLADEVDVDSRLYYAYLEKRDLLPSLDVKFGRQFLATTAGASVMDGLHLVYRAPGDVTLKLFGGGDVAYYQGYNAKDIMAGAEVGIKLAKRADLALSYLQRWDGGDLENELFGFDLDVDLTEGLQLYSETQYDYLGDSVSYFLGGINVHHDPRWSLRGEYLYSLPVFSASSIYSVFAVSEYEEILGELVWRFDDGLRAFGRYTREIYQEVADANVFEAGLEKIRTGKFAGYLSGVVRDDGEGQDLTGVRVHASYQFMPQFQAGLGLDLDVLDRRLDTFGAGGDEFDDTTSSRVWADAEVIVTKTVSVQAKVERVESDLWDEYYRGRVRLNVTF